MDSTNYFILRRLKGSSNVSFVKSFYLWHNYDWDILDSIDSEIDFCGLPRNRNIDCFHADHCRYVKKNTENIIQLTFDF